MNLPPLIRTFVFHFGEMGSRWGINRTVGQIYALIYLSEKPLNAEQLAEALGFSRSNISMGLKELDSWRLVRLKHLPGDRRDYYTAPGDVWEIVRTLVEERRKREIEPTLTMLRDIMLETPHNADERHAQARMREMHDLIEMLTGWYQDMQKMETERLVQLLKMGSRIYKLYEMRARLKLIPGGRARKGNGYWTRSCCREFSSAPTSHSTSFSQPSPLRCAGFFCSSSCATMRAATINGSTPIASGSKSSRCPSHSASSAAS
jgi:DNA-binding transcriptional regulator GbsR (MarR family)